MMIIDNKSELQLESQISRYFMKDNGVTCHFRYEDDKEDGDVFLCVYTFNKDTNTSFLFHKVKGASLTTALTKALNYLKEVMPEENNYTVKWRKEGEEEERESYFRGSDIEEVVNKFYFGKDRETITVTDVNLNPIS